MKKILAILLFFTSQVCLANFTDGVECNNCTSTQYKNSAKDKYRYNQTGTVYVFDFGYGILKKYRVIHEVISTKSVESKLEYLLKIGMSKKTANQIYLDSLKVPSSKNFIILAAIEEQPTNDEVYSFNEIDGLIRQAESGIGDFDIDVPGSAYDYIGCPSCETDLGLWLINNHTYSVWWRESLAQFTETFDINAINFSFEYTITVTFSDGSTVTIVMQNNQLSVVDGSYYDSDNNEIPRVRSDLDGTNYVFVNGNGANINNFLDRARSFGIPIVSGGGSGGRSCSFECDTSGDCTITCSRN